MSGTSGSGTLKIERMGSLARLIFSNPLKRNALDPPLLEGLIEAITELPKEGVRAAILTGEGDLFSSGYDIAALPDQLPSESSLARASAALAEGDLPVVAALNGHAIGGGCELAARCDLRVAHPGVELWMPPVRLGLVYSARGLERFVALIGVARVRELFLTAERISAEQAHAWGLLDHLVPRETLLEHATALAEKIAKGAPLAVAGTRRALARLERRLNDEDRAELARLEALSFGSEDAKEAQRAFTEKRKPEWKGR